MGDNSVAVDDGVLDVSESDVEELARSKSPILIRAAQRILADAIDPNDVSTGFNSSI